MTCRDSSVSAPAPDRSAPGGREALRALDAEVIKTVVPVQARSGASVRCAITLRSRSALPITGIRVTDPAWEGALEIDGLYLNGRRLPAEDLRLGAAVPDLAPGRCAVLTFSAAPCARTFRLISGAACVSYCLAGGGRRAAVSNTAVLRAGSPALTISRSAGRTILTREEPYLTCALTVSNPGARTVPDILITDALNSRLTYVPGTTALNGGVPVDQNPASGVHPGALPPGQSAQITFQMKYIF